MVMPDPCPLCGRDRDLVGISHLCVTPTVTKSVTKSKAGRHAIGAKAMSQAERAKKYRAKKVAKRSGR